MLLLLLCLLPFLGSVVAAFLPSNARNTEAWLAGGVALAGVIINLLLYPQITEGGVLRVQLAWLPGSGLDFVLRLDGLAWLFSMLITGIGLLVVVYARYYMSPKDPVPRFFSFLLAFMGAMLGVVLSGNLIQLVLFWELTSLTSFLLIGYWHHRVDARRGARMAFTVTACGGLCLFAGVLLIGHMVGSYDLDVVLAAGDLLREHPLYLPMLILVALGALTKSAQFPFHFWLPHAMAAPTPVSSYLHSATMVKAGVFLLIRLWPVLSGTPEWFWLIAGAGACTLLLGAFIAIFQHDLKGLLAYSTISHLGLITLLLGMGSPLAAVAAIFHVVNHATFKASLFMAAGIIDHESGTRDMRRLSGLWRMMPITSTLAMVASASMAGVPLLNGFLSKEMFFAESLLVGENWWMSVAATVAGIFGVTYSLRFIHDVFFGAPAQDLPHQPHEPNRWMRLPVELLVLLCLVVGVFPAISIGPYLYAAVFSVLGEQAPEYSLAVWHGFNLPLLMSLLALVGGVLLYLALRRWGNLAQNDGVPLLYRFNGKRAYEYTLLRLTRGASWLEHRLASTRLQPQVLLMVLVAVALAALTLQPAALLPGERALTPLDPLFILLWLVGGACAIGAAWQAKFHRLAALGMLGATGVAVCLTFVWFSAPDLALTQLMVETVTTVLLLLGLRWLPSRIESRELGLTTRAQDRLRRLRDLVVAAAAGLGLAALSYAVMTRPVGENIAGFFLSRALPEGGGSNVVNVLLVDFRSFDTLGEISVLAVVALTVYALLRRFRPAPESIPSPRQQSSLKSDPAFAQTAAEQAERGYLMVPTLFMRALFPIMALVAAYFFMRGHNLPGGGFVAGLIFTVAVIVQYMMAGAHWVETHLRYHPHNWIVTGLGLALLTGLGAWLAGYPFLTTHTAHVTLPWLGEIHLPSAFIFDLGVFALVVGASLLILVALAHQSVRSHRVEEHRQQTEQQEPVSWK